MLSEDASPACSRIPQIKILPNVMLPIVTCEDPQWRSMRHRKGERVESPNEHIASAATATSHRDNPRKGGSLTPACWGRSMCTPQWHPPAWWKRLRIPRCNCVGCHSCVHGRPTAEDIGPALALLKNLNIQETRKERGWPQGVGFSNPRLFICKYYHYKKEVLLYY